MKTAAEILTFWFDEHGPADWFAGKPEFDAEIAAAFCETHAAVRRGTGGRPRPAASPRFSCWTNFRGSFSGTIRALLPATVWR